MIFQSFSYSILRYVYYCFATSTLFLCLKCNINNFGCSVPPFCIKSHLAVVCNFFYNVFQVLVCASICWGICTCIPKRYLVGILSLKSLLHSDLVSACRWRGLVTAGITYMESKSLWLKYLYPFETEIDSQIRGADLWLPVREPFWEERIEVLRLTDGSCALIGWPTTGHNYIAQSYIQYPGDRTIVKWNVCVSTSTITESLNYTAEVEHNILL